MISLGDELEKFPPIDIEGLEERNGSIPEDVRNSIILYNKALNNIRISSEDIAIIELKKAVSLNPHFHEAMNLLGVCYSYTKEYEKAAEIFKKVVEAENNSVKALEYLKLLGGDPESRNVHKSAVPKKSNAVVEKKQVVKPQEKKRAEVSPKNPVFKSFDFQREIIKYGIGFLAGALVVFLIGLPFRGGGRTPAPPENTENQTPAVTPANEYESKYNQLNGEYQKLQQDFQQVSSELEYYRSVSKLEQASSLYSARNYEGAADLLVSLRTAGLKDAEKDKFENLSRDVFPRAAWAVYQEGRNFFNNQNYTEAAVKMAKVQDYGGEWDYVPDSLYKLGVSYIKLNEKEKALECFKKLKEKYPNSQSAKDADVAAAEIGG